jgi:hypothetical protein
VMQKFVAVVGSVVATKKTLNAVTPSYKGKYPNLGGDSLRRTGRIGHAALPPE